MILAVERQRTAEAAAAAEQARAAADEAAGEVVAAEQLSRDIAFMAERRLVSFALPQGASGFISLQSARQ